MKIDFRRRPRDIGGTMPPAHRPQQRIAVILAAVLAMLAMLVPAAAAAQDIPAIGLRTGEDAPPLAPHVRYRVAPAGAASLDPAALLAGPLARVTGPTIHFGPPGRQTLVAVKVRNIGEQQGSWIFTTGRGSLSHFRLYEVAGGRLDLLVDGSDPEAARANLRTYQAFSTEFVLDPGQEKLLLIDFLSENSTYLPLKINSYGSFFKERRANIAMVSGVVFGAVVLILLNFLFFSITGHREFIWLATAQIFFALNTVHSEGYITIFFLADAPLVGVAIEDFFKCGFAAAMAQFGRAFVDTRTHFPRSDRALRLLIAAALAIMVAQPALALYPPGVRHFLHIGGWLVAVAVALFLPFVGFAAMQQLGRQLWPLFVGWASLALFIIYAAIASMGYFAWLPINWHLAGPVGLFESIMVTVALGLNLKKIQNDKLAADRNYARSMQEQLAISERAARLAEEKAFALETVNSQNALLHASGHDSKQVILALNTAIDVLKRGDAQGVHAELTDMLQSSAAYLGGIVSTTLSGANIVGSDRPFLAIGAFDGAALVEPLRMMFKTPFADKRLTLETRAAGAVTILSDKPLLMRAIANLLSNSYKYTETGGASVTLERQGAEAIVTIRDTGRGMPAEVAAALNGDRTARLRADESVHGTGSGFRSAKRLIEALGGSLAIADSTPAGTTLRIVLPCAFAAVTPCPAEQLQAGLAEWRLLDFDRREAFDAALAAAEVPRERIVALTYDDTTVARGRLGDMVGLMLIKPPCRELLRHPALRRSEQL
ncbi:MAG TPA: ATP-binding protein [Sphingopyxis sp.]|nr:ATP-binding protein [Sphingopyxis sp.]